MAFNINTSITGRFNLPLSIGRLNPLPVDSSTVWATYEEARAYAQSDVTAYVGQILFVKADASLYLIADTSGTLTKIITSSNITSELTNLDEVSF